MKRIIIQRTGLAYVVQVCPCHKAAIWPNSEYDSHIERVRQIRDGEIDDPTENRGWRKRNNDRINRWKKRKKDLDSGEKR